MKQPPSIEPAETPGPGYDPMDRIVENLQNLTNFVNYLNDSPRDLEYLKSHLSHILALRRTLSHELQRLEDEPYSYPADRLKSLHKQNEELFVLIEGVVGCMNPWNEQEFKKQVIAFESAADKFDNTLTP